MERLYALIENGTVVNVIVADDEFVSTHHPSAIRVDALIPTPGIGWTYADGGFQAPCPTRPEPSEPSVSERTFTKLEFRRLFSMYELVAIDNFAANTVLSADQKATMTTIMHNFDVASEINVSDPLTQQGVNYIESIGLIASGRASQILSGQQPA